MIKYLRTDKHEYVYDDELPMSNTKSNFYIFINENKEEVIMKATLTQFLSSEDFYREVNTQLACNSEFVVPIFDYGYIESDEKSYFYIIMPRYLSDLCLYTDFSFNEKLVLIKQMISSLKYVHEHKVIHRDIKPDNYFLPYCGRVVLGDFGSAHFTNEEIKSFSLKDKGTATFMAPECYLDQIDTIQNDIYSLGLSIYYLITENFPFESKVGTYEDWEKIHKSSPIPTIVLNEWSFINPFLEKLSAINPQNRYSSLYEALIDYEELISLKK